MKWLKGFDKNRHIVDKEYSIKDAPKKTIKTTKDKKQPKQPKQKRTKLKSISDMGIRGNAIVYGPNGVGKSTIVRTVAKTCGYEICTPDFDRLNGKNSFEQNLTACINTSDIMKQINGEEVDKRIVIIDSIESIISNNHTIGKFLKDLADYNNLYWMYPVVFVIKSKHCSLLNELKKMAFNIHIIRPTVADSKKLILKLTNNDNIEIDKDANSALVEFSQGDLRTLLSSYEDVKNRILPNGLRTITKQDIMVFDVESKKNVDVDLNDALLSLFYEFKSYEECIRLYEIDKTKMPVSVHMNYHDYIIENMKSGDERDDVIADIAEHLSLGDVHDAKVFNGKETVRLTGFYSCAYPSYIINKHIKKPKKDFRPSFSDDKSKTSNQRKNDGNISNTKPSFTNIINSDYVYIGKILRFLLDSKDYKEIALIMKSYNIDFDLVESLLKIDKIKITAMDQDKGKLLKIQKRRIGEFL